MLSFTHHPAPKPGVPRVALIHSLALDRSVWDGVVARLKDEAEILTFDCRGHGRSPRTPGPYAADMFARDLAELLDHVGWAKVVVAGCSMGGNVAQAFAAEFPQRTAALGLIDTTAWYGADAAAKFKERADAARSKGLHGLIDFQLTRWFSDGFRVNHPEVLTRTTDVFVANDV
jgi:3-oxoadipate enol-lactonase